MQLELTPTEVTERKRRGEKIRLIDVRDPWEYELVHLEGAELIPMGDIPAHLPELMKDEDSLVVCYCHLGQRSATVAEWLRKNGIDNAVSVAGGIDRWSRDLDPTITRY